MIDYLRRVLETNLAQREEEGVVVDEFRSRLEQRSDPTATFLLDMIEELEAASVSGELAGAEPSDLAEIIAACPNWPDAPLASDLPRDEVADRVLGGWLGRAAGCRLGRPLEAAPMGHRREDIRRYLESIDQWPLTYYIESESVADALDPAARRPFQGMVRDDDLDYAILNLILLEQHGRDWTHAEARNTWLQRLSHDFIYAAGRSAYTAFCLGKLPPGTATWGNPCRQSLGGMIRCDIWGWVCPGDPASAARLAYRDATISQTANGVYSAMLFAAAIAASFCASDSRQALEQGLRCVPPGSRLAEAARLVLQVWDGEQDWSRTLDAIYQRYSSQYFNAAIINACIVALALLEGQGDFGRTICAAACAGFDADCTAATAGSISGAGLGASALPAHWTSPLNDTYETFIAGLGLQRFSELAKRTVACLREQV